MLLYVAFESFWGYNYRMCMNALGVVWIWKTCFQCIDPLKFGTSSFDKSPKKENHRKNTGEFQKHNVWKTVTGLNINCWWLRLRQKLGSTNMACNILFGSVALYKEKTRHENRTKKHVCEIMALNQPGSDWRPFRRGAIVNFCILLGWMTLSEHVGKPYWYIFTFT